MKELTDFNFNEEVKSGFTLVDFWAEWCMPCKIIAPILEEIDVEYDTVTVGKLDVDHNPQTAQIFGIFSIPTVILFKDGQAVDQIVGAMPKNAFISMLKKNGAI